eukprot:gene18512-22208_t
MSRATAGNFAASPMSLQSLARHIPMGQQTMLRTPKGKRTGVPVDREAELTPWFLGGLGRSELKAVAMDVLRNGAIGEFFVRDVASNPNALGLSVKVGNHDLRNYLILPKSQNNRISVMIRGTNEVFSSLSELIAFYALRPRPALPCQLMMRGQRSAAPQAQAPQDSETYGEIYGMMQIPPATPISAPFGAGAALPAAAAAAGVENARFGVQQAQHDFQQQQLEQQGQQLQALQAQQKSAMAAAAGRAAGAGAAMTAPTMEAAKRLIEIERTLLEKEKTTNAEALALVIKQTDQELAQARALVEQRDKEIKKMEVIARDVQEAKMHAQVATHATITSNDRTSMVLNHQVIAKAQRVKARREALARRQAKHRAALERRKAGSLAKEKASLNTYLSNYQSGAGRVDSNGTGSSQNMHASPMSPTGSSMSIDRLERERRSSLDGKDQSPQGYALGGGGGVMGLDGGGLMDDPNAMWQVITSSSAAHNQKLQAAQAQLDYLRKEEAEVLAKLQTAQTTATTTRTYTDNETVIDEDYENATLIDEESGEVFGFAGLLGAVEEEETYGFGD